MNAFWNNVIWGNSVRDWAIALGIMVTGFLVFRIAKSLVVNRIRNWAHRTSSAIDDFIVTAIEKFVLPFFYLLSIFIGLSYLSFGDTEERVIKASLLVVETYFSLRLFTAFISFLVTSYTHRHGDAETKLKQARGIIIIVNVLIWVVGLIFLVDNLGYNITTLITGLGIGGVAIALAAQAVLADLFSYFVIFFDKPFEIGDFIIVGDKMGTVEYVGIKTTRLRALSGEQLVMANKDLTNSRVQNYKRMEKRRVVFSITVTYETSAEKLKKIPSLIKEIIESQQQTQFDRGHFASFSDFSLVFEFVYYVLSADYNVYMDKQQAVNFAIFDAFERENISFAYPTQTIYMGNGSLQAIENASRKTSHLYS